jgi:hypothetical protein
VTGRRGFTAPEVWSSGTAWTASGARLGLTIEPRDSTMGPSWSTFLAWSP